MLFSDFVSDLEGGMEFTLNKFADHTDIKEQREILGESVFQGDIDVLEEWTNGNLTRVKEEKCKALPLGRKHPCSSSG